MAVLADGRLHGICLTLEKGRLEISARSVAFGEAKEEIETAYAQDVLQIGFNADYTLDFLGTVLAVYGRPRGQVF